MWRAFCWTAFSLWICIKNNFKERSDLDFALVLSQKIDPIQQGEQFFKLKIALEDLFKKEVDLISFMDIKNPIFKKEIDDTKVELYAA